MNLKEKVELVIGIIIAVAILGTLYEWPDNIISLTIEWGTTILISIILSGVAGRLVENFTGDFLKKILIPVEIGPFKFSVSLFIIATFLVRWILFK